MKNRLLMVMLAALVVAGAADVKPVAEEVERETIRMIDEAK